MAARLMAARLAVKKFLDSHLFHQIVIAVLGFDVFILFVEHILLIVRFQSLQNICKAETLISPEVLEEASWIVSIELFFRIMTFIIVCAFMVEVIVKIFTYGLAFFESLWNIFDFVVISAAFAGEIVLANYSEFIVTLLLPIRVIRLLRFSHAVLEIQKEREEDLHRENHIVEVDDSNQGTV